MRSPLRSLIGRLVRALALVLWTSVPSAAQVTIPNTFTAGTVANPDQVNTNFSTLGTQALNRTGGTMTGTLTTLNVVPAVDNAYDLGSGAARYQDAFLAGTLAVGGTSTLTGAVAMAGLLTNTAFGTHAFSAAGGPGANVLGVRNTQDGAANFGRLQVGNFTTAALGVFDAYAPAYTSVGYQTASGVLVGGLGAGGLTLAATDASATVRIHAAGTVAPALTVQNAFVSIGPITTTSLTQGLILNQGANDDEIQAWKSSDVAHGMTAITGTDTYGRVGKFDPAVGGLFIGGLSEGEAGLNLQGVATTANTSKTVAASGAVYVTAYLRDGTGVQPMTADGNLFIISDAGQARWFVDKEGDTYRDGSDNTFSLFDDVALALTWEHVMSPVPPTHLDEAFRRYSRYNADALITAGLLAPRDPQTGRHFYNESALLRVVTGGLWQLGIAQDGILERLAALEAALAGGAR